MCVLIPLQKTNAQLTFNISKLQGDNQTGEISQTLLKKFTVRVTGVNDQNVGDFDVRFFISEQPEGANASLDVTDVKTKPNGKARSQLTLGSIPGTYKVEASIGIFFGSVTFTATATAPTDPYGVSLGGVGDLTQTVTEGVISEDVRYTLRVTNTGTESDTIDLAVSGDLSGTLSQSPVILQGSGTADVTLTIPASALTNPGTYEVTVTATSRGDTTQTDEVTATVVVEVQTSYGVELTAVDSLMQTVDVNSGDVRYALRVTNTGTETDTIDLDVSGDVQDARLSKTRFTLESGASENVDLIIPFLYSALLTRTSQFKVTVTAESEADSNETAEVITTTTIKILSDGIEVKLAAVGSLAHTTATTDTEDITYILRVTNSGDELDQVHLTVSGDVDTATIEPTAVVLEPETYADVTVTIPRRALSEAGTYSVNVRATSELDSTVTVTVATKTVITSGNANDTPTPDTPTPVQTTRKVFLANLCLSPWAEKMDYHNGLKSITTAQKK
jgi:uncharacterized membrane protein